MCTVQGRWSQTWNKHHLRSPIQPGKKHGKGAYTGACELPLFLKNDMFKDISSAFEQTYTTRRWRDNWWTFYARKNGIRVENREGIDQILIWVCCATVLNNFLREDDGRRCFMKLHFRIHLRSVCVVHLWRAPDFSWTNYINEVIISNDLTYMYVCSTLCGRYFAYNCMWNFTGVRLVIFCMYPILNVKWNSLYQFDFWNFQTLINAHG